MRLKGQMERRLIDVRQHNGSGRAVPVTALKPVKFPPPLIRQPDSKVYPISDPIDIAAQYIRTANAAVPTIVPPVGWSNPTPSATSVERKHAVPLGGPESIKRKRDSQINVHNHPARESDRKAAVVPNSRNVGAHVSSGMLKATLVAATLQPAESAQLQLHGVLAAPFGSLPLMSIIIVGVLLAVVLMLKKDVPTKRRSSPDYSFTATDDEIERMLAAAQSRPW